MGCDIHVAAERRSNGKWVTIEGLRIFNNRDYGRFGFLADVRNYSHVPPISQPRGYPNDSPNKIDDDPDEPFGSGYHSASWLSVEELKNFDYNQTFENRRITVEERPGFFNGAALAEPGRGEFTTYRDFLGEGFFEDIEKLVASGAERIVFRFDS